MRVRLFVSALALSGAFCLATSSTFAQTADVKPATPLAATAPTAVPALVPFSGSALAADGKPLTGEASITFAIYKDESGGEPLFAESQTIALDPAGHYKAQLGATLSSGLPLELFTSGEARWLEVQIAGQKPEPRILLVSVPYALKAGDASTLGGLPASAYALAASRTADPAAPAITSAVTPAVATDVTTTGGTSGYVPEFTGAATVADSPIFINGANVGIGTATPTATLDVTGSGLFTGALTVDGITTMAGELSLPPRGTATAAAASNSQFLKVTTSAYNSSTATVVQPRFQIQAEVLGNNTASPTGTLNVLASNGTPTPTETGLYIHANGIVNFAPGQTFPNTGPGTITGVTPGSGLVGGGTSGSVSLSVDPSQVSLLMASTNTFSGNQDVLGIVVANGLTSLGPLVSNVPDGTAPFSIASTTVVPNLNASLLGGLPPSAFVTTAVTNTFTQPQSFSRIGVGTVAPRSLVELSSAARAALGSVLTLTNTAGSAGAATAVDFNSVAPSTTGTYNPAARIVAVDAGGYSDNIVFQSNIPGALNHGLQTNLTIQSTGNFVMPYLSLLANGQLASTLATGTAPFSVTSTTVVPNLNAGLLGGLTSKAFAVVAGSNSFNATQNFQGTSSGSPVGNGVNATGGYASSGQAGAGGVFNGGNGPIGGDGIDANPGTGFTGSYGYAGNFGGNVNVYGEVEASVNTFKIDDPLDSPNRYLVHASVESSEMMNIYSGNVVTDELGLATVKLPDWFQAENADFRYQLTTIGRDAHAWIAEEVAHGQFKIATNATQVKVSWQITAVRQDAFAKAHPLIVERVKPENERGFYIHPELFGQPEEKQTEWGRNPEQMQYLKGVRQQSLIDLNRSKPTPQP